MNKHWKIKKAEQHLLLWTPEADSLVQAEKLWFCNLSESESCVDQPCELCGEQHLNVRYLIRKKTDHNFLKKVGSSCILKFQTDVYDFEGQLLPLNEREKLFEFIKRKIRAYNKKNANTSIISNSLSDDYRKAWQKAFKQQLSEEEKLIRSYAENLADSDNKFYWEITYKIIIQQHGVKIQKEVAVLAKQLWKDRHATSGK